MQADSVTALVLSASPYSRTFEGIKVVSCVQSFNTVEGLHQARCDAIAHVETPWFFFLDDDDDLPGNIEFILEKSLDLAEEQDAKLVYTNEVMQPSVGDITFMRGAPYSQDEHARRPMLVHHLALCHTETARQALQVIPRGDHWTELLLYWQMAKSGAAWFDHYGYIWNRRNTGGVHTWPKVTIAQMNSLQWCKANP